MQPGDVLKHVDGHDVTGRSIRDLRSLVPGPLGSRVTVGFDSQQGPYDIGMRNCSRRILRLRSSFRVLSHAVTVALFSKGSHFRAQMAIQGAQFYSHVVVLAELDRVQSNRGAPTVYGGGGRGGPRAQRAAAPVNNEGKAYVGFSVQMMGDPRGAP